MGGIVVKIKDNVVRCEKAIPNIKHNIAQPKFECKIQGVVIQGGGSIDLAALTALLVQYPICKNQDIARGAPFNLDTDDIFWYSLDSDEGIPYTLARVRPL